MLFIFVPVLGKITFHSFGVQLIMWIACLSDVVSQGRSCLMQEIDAGVGGGGAGSLAQVLYLIVSNQKS